MDIAKDIADKKTPQVYTSNTSLTKQIEKHYGGRSRLSKFRGEGLTFILVFICFYAYVCMGGTIFTGDKLPPVKFNE